MWTYPEAMTGSTYYSLFSAGTYTGVGNGTYCRMSESQRITCLYSGGSETNAYSYLPSSQWNQITIARNLTKLNIYINGTRIASGTYPASNLGLDMGTIFHFGTNPTISGDWFTGHMDEIRVSNRDICGDSDICAVQTTEYKNVTPGTTPDFTANVTKTSTYSMQTVLTNNTPPDPITSWNWSVANMSVRYTSQKKEPLFILPTAGQYWVNGSFTNSTDTTFVNKSIYLNLTSDADSYLPTRIQFTGTSGSTDINDVRGIAWTSSSVSISNTQSKFNGTSGAFLSPGSFITTPSSSRFNFSAGDFTIEQWVYPLTTGADYTIVARSTSPTLSNGWGLYHESGATSYNWKFYMGNRAVNATDPFFVPLNRWSHVVVERSAGNVTVYVNGTATVTKIFNGPYDVQAPLIYGDAGTGVRSFDGYLDETGISTVQRFGTNYEVPQEQYHGDLWVTDPNPLSTYRFKTDPTYPSAAVISNLTPRNRTIQIENVYIANNISARMSYNPNNVFVKKVRANQTAFTTGINFTYVQIDQATGTVNMNITRPGGFSSPTGARSSVIDVEMVYYNYTQPGINGQEYFSTGFLGNLSSVVDYPVHDFIETNMTHLDWVTFSNFSANQTKPYVNTPVKLFTELNYTANIFTIDWGDGTVETITHRAPNHTYMSLGEKTISVTSFLTWNTSVTNTTTRLGAVNVTYTDDTLVTDFVASQTSVPPSSLVQFTSTSIVANSTNIVYNWSFGDGGFAQNQTNPSHVYAYSGIFTVSLNVTNVNKYGVATDTETKLDYITVAQSSATSTTWWTPHTVTVTILTLSGQVIPGVNVTAHYNESSMPTTWVNELYGIQGGPASDMVNQTLTMTGTTGGDGDITFTMLGSLKYDFYLTSAENGLNNYHVAAFPADPLLNIYVDSTAETLPTTGNSTYEAINSTRLYVYEPDINHVDMCIDFKDDTGFTSSVKEQWIFQQNETVANETIFPPGNYMNTHCYRVDNVRGVSYWWGLNATRED